MVLYVDETECPEYFIVTGLLVNSKQDVDMAYKRFKKYAKTVKVSEDDKAGLFTEFKSTILDRHYKNIKRQMLLEINNFDYCTVFSCHIKKEKIFIQSEKENTYISLLTRIVNSITSPVDIIFDAFNKPAFEKRIVSTISNISNVLSISAMDSQREHGVQYADNLCSVIRMNKTNTDVYDFYKLIEEKVREV